MQALLLSLASLTRHSGTCHPLLLLVMIPHTHVLSDISFGKLIHTRKIDFQAFDKLNFLLFLLSLVALAIPVKTTEGPADQPVNECVGNLKLKNCLD